MLQRTARNGVTTAPFTPEARGAVSLLLAGVEDRLLQCATGYVATFPGGVAVVEGDRLTGEMPGQMLR